MATKPTVKTSISFSQDQIKELDKMRGFQSRSAFIKGCIDYTVVDRKRKQLNQA